MIIKEAIILAGGLGTRFRGLTASLPKCMVPIHGRPFISYVINYLNAQGVERFIFSLGYQHDIIRPYIEKNHSDIIIDFVTEQEPLDTGGATKLACTKATQPEVLLMYGDTFFDIDLEAFCAFHTDLKPDCSLSLKPMQNITGYSAITLNEDGHVNAVSTEQNGLVSGGIFALNVAAFLRENMPEKFSFEKDYIEALCRDRMFYGLAQDAFFLDINTPSDYTIAKDEL